MKAQATPKTDVYTRVTERIVSALEAGTRPWLQPWSAPKEKRMSSLPLRSNGVPYRGINVVLLWWDAIEKGFTRNVWMTFKQAQERGAHVRKGEKGSMVVYADRATTTETNEAGESVEREYAFWKAYTVFNVEQIEGLPAEVDATDAQEVVTSEAQLIEEAEAFFAATGATFRHGGHRAFYSVGPANFKLPELQPQCGPSDQRDDLASCGDGQHALRQHTP